MNDSLMSDSMKDELLQLWGDEYERQRASGVKHAVARVTATDELKRAYHPVAEWMSAATTYRVRSGENTPAAKAGMSLTASMGHLGRRLREKWDAQKRPPIVESPSMPPQSSNGNGTRKRSLPGLVTYESGMSNVTKTIIDALAQMELKRGDVVHFGNMYLWSYIIGCIPAAIPNLIQGLNGQTTIADAGYIFDVQDKSHSNFVITVTETPQTGRDKEVAEIKAQIDELMKRLNSL